MENAAARENYHHGDLRTALLETGLGLLSSKAGSEIGLREVARETGVSATAVYRHFPDKDALLDALAHEGYERLADVQEATAARATDEQTAFRASGRAYIEFAVANPALFMLMSNHMSIGRSENDGKPRSQNRAGRLLERQVDVMLPDTASEKAKSVAVTQAWALVHGLAVLIIGGQIPNDPDLIEAAVSEFGGW
jgi:AcrR family transcriptional regulator